MYANAYGVEGVEKVTEILRSDLITDSGNLGLESLADVDAVFWKMGNVCWFLLTAFCRSIGNLIIGTFYVGTSQLDV